jgi:hypothetical protein
VSIPIGVALAGVLELIDGIRKAIEAGSPNLNDEDVDKAVSALEASDRALTDAIIRARARENQ